MHYREVRLVQQMAYFVPQVILMNMTKKTMASLASLWRSALVVALDSQQLQLIPMAAHSLSKKAPVSSFNYVKTANSPIHTALWVRGSCTNSPCPPLWSCQMQWEVKFCCASGGIIKSLYKIRRNVLQSNVTWPNNSNIVRDQGKRVGKKLTDIIITCTGL